MATDRIGFNYFKSLPSSHIDEHANACQTMFRAIIDQMVEDLLSIPRTEEDRRNREAAAKWFNREIPEGYTEAPMDEVCDLAQVPVVYVLHYVREYGACLRTQ